MTQKWHGHLAGLFVRTNFLFINFLLDYLLLSKRTSLFMLAASYLNYQSIPFPNISYLSLCNRYFMTIKHLPHHFWFYKSFVWKDLKPSKTWNVLIRHLLFSFPFFETWSSNLCVCLSDIKRLNPGGQQSTEVAYVLLTQQPWVRFSAHTRIFKLGFYEI